MSAKKSILQYDDLKDIPTRDNGESCVVIQDEAPEIVCKYMKQDMVPLYGEHMYARESVVVKLKQAQKLLEKRQSDAKLKVVYAYRDVDVQKKYFNARMEEMKKKYPDADEHEHIIQAHLLSASPDVAGHPTGGAIDITITGPGGEYDMGGAIADFSDAEKIQTFYRGLTYEQKHNRMLLREILMSVGFAPFDGEWWHFCYGDKEWAVYYDQPHAIYGPIKLRN